MIDLVSDGSSWEEIVELAQRIEDAGATIINTGIGWHEARVPTIATMVPRGSYAWVTKKMKGLVKIPLCTSNRINTPEVDFAFDWDIWVTDVCISGGRIHSSEWRVGHGEHGEVCMPRFVCFNLLSETFST
jgi:hypothetical protein